MKFLKQIVSALLLCALTLSLLISCNNGTSSDDTEAPTEAPTEESLPEVTLNEIFTDKTTFELKTGDSVLGLEVREDNLYITELSTKAGGTNRAQIETPYALPLFYYIGEETARFNWEYAGYMNLRGETDYEQYGYSLIFKDETAKFTYDLQITAHFKFDGPFEFTGYLRNDAEVEADVQPNSFFRLETQGEEVPTVWSFHKEGDFAEGWVRPATGKAWPGTGLYQTLLSDGIVMTHTSTDSSLTTDNGDCIPMIYADYGTWGSYVAVEWTNVSIIAAEGPTDGSCVVQTRLGDPYLSKIFRTTVPAGESILIPTVYMGVYDGDVDEGSNVFKRWFLYNKAPDILLEDENEPLVQADMQIGLDSADYGIESLKWDTGWWSDVWVGPDFQKTDEGLLELHASDYINVLAGYGCTTIAEFAKLVNEKGMILTLYHMLKDTQLDREGVPTSVGEYGHPEWFANRFKPGNYASADLGNEECVAFYQEYMLEFFKTQGVTTWRSDFEPIARQSDKANRHDANGTDVQYWCTVGFCELVDYLYENLDYFRYESCSSGGSMKDFLTMTRAVYINCEDSAYFQSAKMVFYDSSFCVHPAQLQLPVDAGTSYPGSDRYEFGNPDYGMMSTMLGAVMTCDWGGVEDYTREVWEKYIPTYKEIIRPLIKYGNLYHVLPRPDGINWDGFLYTDKDAESEYKGVLMIFKPSAEAGDSKTVKLRGLDPDTTYYIEYFRHEGMDFTVTGAELMNEGITVTFTDDCDSDWVFIKTAE